MDSGLGNSGDGLRLGKETHGKCVEDRTLKVLALGIKGLSEMQNTSKGLVAWMKVQELWVAWQVDIKGQPSGADALFSSFL